MLALWILLPVLAGALLTVQAAVNGSLGRKAGSEIATLVSFFMGTVALGVVLLFWGGGGLGKLFQVPHWQLLALVWGVMFVFLVVLVVPKIGVVVTTVLVIVGQLGVSMVVDRFGLFGNAVIPFGGKRLVGMLLMLAALYFIFRAKHKR